MEIREDIQLTFRVLDNDCVLRPPESPLEKWYISVRDIPIDDLPDGDLARACRQKRFVDMIVPLCLNRIKENPMAGDLYDGELIVALKSIPATYWSAHRDYKNIFLGIAEKAYSDSGDLTVYVDQKDVGNSELGSENIEDPLAFLKDTDIAQAMVALEKKGEGDNFTVSISLAMKGGVIISQIAPSNSIIQLPNGEILDLLRIKETCEMGARHALFTMGSSNYSVSINEVSGKFNSRNIGICASATSYAVLRASGGDGSKALGFKAGPPNGWEIIDCQVKNPLSPSIKST